MRHTAGCRLIQIPIVGPLEPFVSIVVAAGAASVVAGLAVRDHRRARANRRSLLDHCSSILSNARTDFGGDGFPCVTGLHAGCKVRAALIPDTMTIRRLPQLWLSVTRTQSLPVTDSLAVLVRPSGNDFYSLTESLGTTLTPSPDLPWEVLVRGSGTHAQELLYHLAGTIGKVLADPRVKEVAVTPKGLRIVRQTAEGRRGEHLLLRQAVFDNASVPAHDFEQLLAALDMLAAELGGWGQKDQKRQTA